MYCLIRDSGLLVKGDEPIVSRRAGLDHNGGGGVVVGVGGVVVTDGGALLVPPRADEESGEEGEGEQDPREDAGGSEL